MLHPWTRMWMTNTEQQMHANYNQNNMNKIEDDLHYFGKYIDPIVEFALIGNKKELEREHQKKIQGKRETKHHLNTDVCAASVLGNHFNILKWARENGYPWDERVCYIAALKGYDEIFKWAVSNECPRSAIACNYIAKRGKLGMLMWAFENGCPINTETFIVAIECEHHDIVQWISSKGIIKLFTSCEYAAKMGYTKLLKYLYHCGTGWRLSESVCNYAAERGDLDTIKWARRNGCPWNEMIYGCVFKNENITKEKKHEIIDWIIKNDGPYNEEVEIFLGTKGYTNQQQ